MQKKTKSMLTNYLSSSRESIKMMEKLMFLAHVMCLANKTDFDFKKARKIMYKFATKKKV